MSEFINNREHRQQLLKDILLELHNDVPVEIVKQHFAQAFSHVDAQELADAERALVEDGLPVSAIQKLCDIHAEVVGTSIEAIHNSTSPLSSSHPLQVMKQENNRLLELLDSLRKNYKQLPLPTIINKFRKEFEMLREINKHYLRKENLLFPYMEKYNIEIPPKVMWGVHDEIREKFKQIDLIMNRHSINELKDELPKLFDQIADMIDKEENILFPMIEGLFTSSEWQQIANDSDEFGYFLIDQPKKKNLELPIENMSQAKLPLQDDIDLETGSLSLEELKGLLDTFPLDITFVDKEDRVRYFSHGESRVFPRTLSIIGRNVENCHPQASVHIVKQILDDFKSGKKDRENFWIQMGDRLIYIQYHAVRKNGQYIGVVEMTQDIAPLQKITGEKRI